MPWVAYLTTEGQPNLITMYPLNYVEDRVGQKFKYKTCYGSTFRKHMQSHTCCCTRSGSGDCHAKSCLFKVFRKQQRREAEAATVTAGAPPHFAPTCEAVCCSFRGGKAIEQPTTTSHSFISTAHVHPELGHNHDYDDDGAFIPTATDKRLLLSRRWAHFTLLLLGNWILLIFCPFSFRTPPIDGVETIIPLSIRYAVHTESNEQFILFPY